MSGRFQHLTKEELIEISRKGGHAAHEQGRAHKWTTEEAKLAGSKGGKARGSKALVKGKNVRNEQSNSSPPKQDLDSEHSS